MRKKLKPMVVLVFFAVFIGMMSWTRSASDRVKQEVQSKSEKTTLASSSTTTSSSGAKTKSSEASEKTEPLTAETLKPIIDVSAWQDPKNIDYDVLSKNISGVVVRILSGHHQESIATDEKGIDVAYKTHIEEFQKRGVPVAVYAYLMGSTPAEMESEAENFYKLSAKYKPTYYWLDVEDKELGLSDELVETFRVKLESLGATNIGLYSNTYYLAEYGITTDSFDAVWLSYYGMDSGYYEGPPETELDYDLHQYTSNGYVNGYSHNLDVNLIANGKDVDATFKKLFTIQK